MIDFRILTVLLTFLVVLCVVVCQDLKKDDEDRLYCNTTVTRIEQPTRQIRLLLKKYKACPKGTNRCTTQERKNLPNFKPRTEICCSKPFGSKKSINETVCCDKWRFNKNEGFCEPQCRDGCENGRCVKPDICACDPPLILTDKRKCVQPICDPPCVNSQCIDNNTCSCDTNFSYWNSTHCAPKCETGFKNDQTTLICIPICDPPCQNGTCTGPNVCTCNDGHRKKSDFTCVPDCKPSCINSDCIAPDVCFCFEGYKQDSSSKCSPVCNSCKNGECVAPDTCECHKGYIMKNGTCSAVCGSCENGDCIAPNTCACHDGYSQKNGLCTPDCDQTCINGVCSHPNVCTCDLGYEPHPKNKFSCLPLCEINCINASCIAPNTCSCYSGYEKAGNDWTCKPKCYTCENGDCTAPNVCECHDGYLEEWFANTTICNPVCDACEHGICVAPDKCSCDKGYSKKGTDKCTADCDKGCVNASCESPNNCKCFAGYKPTKNKFICEPKCTSCQHGQCVAPDDCKCHDGYKKIAGKCSPVCLEPCVNGYCTSPNTCSCKDEYVKNSTRPSVCQKPCKGPCHNGVCSMHGECLCNRGYELANDTCLPMAPVDCSSCDFNCSSGECWCEDSRPCASIPGVEAEVTSTGLAGLELTWMLCGAVALLLLVLMTVVMHRMWRKRKQFEAKADQCNTYGSVVYTVPDTLMQRHIHDDGNIDEEATENVDIDECETETSERLLTTDVNVDENV